MFTAQKSLETFVELKWYTREQSKNLCCSSHPLNHHAAIESNIFVTQSGHSVSDNLVNLLNEFCCCMETIFVLASIPFTPVPRLAMRDKASK